MERLITRKNLILAGMLMVSPLLLDVMRWQASPDCPTAAAILAAIFLATVVGYAGVGFHLACIRSEPVRTAATRSCLRSHHNEHGGCPRPASRRRPPFHEHRCASPFGQVCFSHAGLDCSSSGPSCSQFGLGWREGIAHYASSSDWQRPESCSLEACCSSCMRRT